MFPIDITVPIVYTVYRGNSMELRVRDVPEGLHERFKILCVRERISMNKKMLELIRQAVEAGEDE